MPVRQRALSSVGDIAVFIEQMNLFKERGLIIPFKSLWEGIPLSDEDEKILHSKDVPPFELGPDHPKELVKIVAQLKQIYAFDIERITVTDQLASIASRRGFEREPVEVHPPSTTDADADPYHAQQGYLTEIGWESAIGLTGGEVRLIDIEQGWTIEHEEFLDTGGQPRLRRPIGVNHRFHGHGTSVLGVLAAGRQNKKGLTGMLPELDIRLISQYWQDEQKQIWYNTTEAILTAVVHGRFLRRGDILLIQAQHFDPKTGLLLPVEADPIVWLAVRLAVLLGIVVIEAAGNGGAYLPSWSSTGAILVAAATSHDPDFNDPHRPLFFSNRGAQVDCYAWGEEVITTGDGETSLEHDDYNGEFGGTSAAAAIVAGVAAVIQSIARKNGQCLDGSILRDILTRPQNGIPPAVGADCIGVLPSIEKILQNERAQLGL